MIDYQQSNFTYDVATLNKIQPISFPVTYLCQLALSIAILFAAVSTNPSWAVVRAFDNDASDNDWFNPANWDPNGGPDEFDDLTVSSGTPTATSTVTTDSGGSIAVSGAGSVADFSGGVGLTPGLQVGNVGNGSFTLDSAGQVQVSGLTFLGAQAGSRGEVTISDPNTTWSTNSTFVVGFRGEGDLMLLDGAELSSNGGGIGNLATAVGTALVDDATWNSTQVITVGSTGQGTMTVQNGAAITATRTAIGLNSNSVGELTLDASTWDNSGGQVTLGNSGTGNLTIRNGAGMTNNDTSFIGIQANASGTATITGAGSLWDITPDLQVGSRSHGELYALNGGVVASGSGFLGTFGATSNGFARISDPNSAWNMSGIFSVGREGVGRLEILNGGTVTNDSGQVGEDAGSEGTVVVDGAGSLWSITGVEVIGDDGQGTVIVSNGGEMSAALILVEENGLLTGDGQVSTTSNLQIRGRVEPGLSAGVLSIGGSYSQLGGSSLALEIGGATVGTQYDQLAVSSAASLGGDLEISLLDIGGGKFYPSSLDTFTVLTASILTGSLDNVANGGRLSTIGNWGSFQVNYGLGSGFDPNAIVLSDFLASADFDMDGDVDSDDLGLWETAYASTDVGDANGDGRSDGLDFLIWQQQFGLGVVPSPAAVSAVPEAGSAGLFLLGCVGILNCRTRRFPCLKKQNSSGRWSR